MQVLRTQDPLTLRAHAAGAGLESRPARVAVDRPHGLAEKSKPQHRPLSPSRKYGAPNSGRRLFPRQHSLHFSSPAPRAVSPHFTHGGPYCDTTWCHTRLGSPSATPVNISYPTAKCRSVRWAGVAAGAQRQRRRQPPLHPLALDHRHAGRFLAPRPVRFDQHRPIHRHPASGRPQPHGVRHRGSSDAHASVQARRWYSRCPGSRRTRRRPRRSPWPPFTTPVVWSVGSHALRGPISRTWIRWSRVWAMIPRAARLPTRPQTERSTRISMTRLDTSLSTSRVTR